MTGMPPKSADSRFAPPIRISSIQTGYPFGGEPALPGPDIAVIVAIYGPRHADKTHDYFVRGVPVSRTSISKTDNGRMYRVCIFPDGREMWVNEGNITSRKRK